MPIVAIIAFALVKCGDNKAASIPPADDPIPVRVQPVTTGNYSRTLQYSGLIASNAEARLSFKIGGIVARIYVKEGDHVSRGQLLATLDLTEIDAQVQQATQNVEKSTRDEDRLKNLYKDTVASLEQVQNIHTQVSVATEALRIAQFNRQYAQIRAAADGTILQKFMNEGEYALPPAPPYSYSMAPTTMTGWCVLACPTKTGPSSIKGIRRPSPSTPIPIRPLAARSPNWPKDPIPPAAPMRSKLP